MPKTKTRSERMQDVVADVENLLSECQIECDRLEQERDAALAEVRSRPIADLSAEDVISEENLAKYLTYDEKPHAWVSRYGRLTLRCRVDGSWWLSFCSTYGGSVGSCRNLKTMTEVLVLLELLGMTTTKKDPDAQAPS